MVRGVDYMSERNVLKQKTATNHVGLVGGSRQ